MGVLVHIPAHAKHFHWLLQSCKSESILQASPAPPTCCWGSLCIHAAPRSWRSKPASWPVSPHWLWASPSECHCPCSVELRTMMRTSEPLTLIFSLDLLSYQSGVIDGDDKIKKRLQSCPVTRRILLNLKTNKQQKRVRGSNSNSHFCSQKLLELWNKTVSVKYCNWML